MECGREGVRGGFRSALLFRYLGKSGHLPGLQSTEKLLNALNTSAKIKRLHADDFMTYEATNSHFARIFKYKKSKNIL